MSIFTSSSTPSNFTTAVVTPLDLEYFDGQTWTLVSNYIVVSRHVGIIRVPAGFVTDFNSIPAPLWCLLPPVEYGEAGVIHDYLYRSGATTRAQADAVHREFSSFRHAPHWKSWAMYWGLRMGGWRAWKAYREPMAQ